MAYVNPSSSYKSLQKFYGDDGSAFVKAYIGSGIAADTPVYVIPAESGYIATALAASVYGIVGVPQGGAVSSGTWATVQIEGYRAGVQGGSGSLTGSAGKAVSWNGTGLMATASANIYGPGQVAILTETVAASSTANMYLTGRVATGI